MKMEEEKSEKNLLKKEKKHKKGQASVPENKNGSVLDGSPIEVKKDKKKRKKNEAVVSEEGSWDGGGEKVEKKKKKKKTEIVNESLTDAMESVEDEGVSKQKKKKKKQQQELADDMHQLEIAQSSEKGGEKKQKKVKKKTVQIQAENETVEKEELQAGKNDILPVRIEEAEQQGKEKKKKKKKTTATETAEAMDGITVSKKENGEELKTPEGEAVVEEVKSKKKKKKMAKIKDGAETPEVKGKSKKLEKDKSEIVNQEEEKTEKRKKGKGRKAVAEVSEVEETEPKKKKRKKENSKGTEEPLLIRCEENDENGQSEESPVMAEGDATRKKSKKRRKEVSVQGQEEGSDVEAVVKKKKKKRKIEEKEEEQQESQQMDVVLKSGNTDEVTINKERGQTLQMEIDMASPPEKPSQPSGLGQWSTAQFDSSEQQQKFLRLMGGFKKGFQPATSNPSRENMAMGKDAQQQLQQGLLGDFERAHSRRMDFNNKGAGLGFSAPSNKKFSIDVNACRSVRFDD